MIHFAWQVFQFGVSQALWRWRAKHRYHREYRTAIYHVLFKRLTHGIPVVLVSCDDTSLFIYYYLRTSNIFHDAFDPIHAQPLTYLASPRPLGTQSPSRPKITRPSAEKRPTERPIRVCAFTAIKVWVGNFDDQSWVKDQFKTSQTNSSVLSQKLLWWILNQQALRVSPCCCKSTADRW